MVVQESLFRSSVRTSGAHEPIDQVEVRLEIVTCGNVDTVEVGGVSAAEPEFSPNVGVNPPGLLYTLLNPAWQS